MNNAFACSITIFEVEFEDERVERSLNWYIMLRRTGSVRSVTMWDDIRLDYRTSSVCINGTRTSYRYILEVLQHTYIPGFLAVTFQQNNVQSHVAAFFSSSYSIVILICLFSRFIIHRACRVNNCNAAPASTPDELTYEGNVECYSTTTLFAEINMSTWKRIVPKTWSIRSEWCLA